MFLVTDYLQLVLIFLAVRKGLCGFSDVRASHISMEGEGRVSGQGIATLTAPDRLMPMMGFPMYPLFLAWQAVHWGMMVVVASHWQATILEREETLGHNCTVLW